MDFDDVSIEKERLAAVGALTAPMSHQLNNILQGINGGAHLVEMGLQRRDWETTQHGWTIVRRNQAKISQFVSDLLMLSKPWEPILQRCDLGEIVTLATQALIPEFELRGVRGSSPDSDHPLPIVVDPDAIGKAVTYLVQLAVQSAESHSDQPLDVSVCEFENHAEIWIEYCGAEIVPAIAPDAFPTDVFPPDVFPPDTLAQHEEATAIGTDAPVDDVGDHSVEGQIDHSADGQQQLGGIPWAVSRMIAESHQGKVDLARLKGNPNRFRITLCLPVGSDRQDENESC